MTDDEGVRLHFNSQIGSVAVMHRRAWLARTQQALPPGKPGPLARAVMKAKRKAREEAIAAGKPFDEPLDDFDPPEPEVPDVPPIHPLLCLMLEEDAEQGLLVGSTL